MNKKWIILAVVVGVVAVGLVFTASLGVVGYLVARGVVSPQNLAGVAYAQASTQVPPANPNSKDGSIPGMMGSGGAMDSDGMMGNGGMMGSDGAMDSDGMMGNGGMMGSGGMMDSGNYGPMHTYMVQALANQLGLKIEDVQARIQAGETPYQIAKAQGKTDEEIKTLMQTAHDEALKSAVAAGAITQAQADLMDQHMEQMWQNGDFGSCQGDMSGSPQEMQPAK